MKRDAFCHVHIVKNTVSKGLGTGRRDGGAVRNTTRVGLQQAAVSDWTVANLRTECCSQNRGHVESKPTCVNEIWLISAKVHHCHSTELPVFPKINSSLLEFIPLWRNVSLEYCVCVQAENTAEKQWLDSIVQNETTLEPEQSQNFVTESQVFPSHSNVNSAMIFTLFEILYYGRYFQLHLLNTQYWFQ